MKLKGHQKLKPPSSDVYAINCLAINLIEAPSVKKKNAIIPSKYLPEKFSNIPPRRNVEINRVG